MRVLVDEDLASRTLLALLGKMHDIDVIAPQLAASDDDVWGRARSEGAAILTGNARDFVPLARADKDHAGLMLVVRGGDPSDMTSVDIAYAVAAVAAAYPNGIEGLTLVVNAFAGR